MPTVKSICDGIESQIVKDVQGNLEKRLAGTWGNNDSTLLWPEGVYIQRCMDCGIPSRPVALWETRLRQLVAEAGKKLPEPIHTGATVYDLGICCFAMGDIDKAMVYFDEAQKADEAKGHYRKKHYDRSLERYWLIAPIVSSLFPYWKDIYEKVTTTPLNEEEFVALLDWLHGEKGEGASNARQLLLALHRLLRVIGCQENDLSRHIRVQALTDMIIVVESSMRWQSAPEGTAAKDFTLQPRIQTMCGGTDIGRAREKLQEDFNNT